MKTAIVLLLLASSITSALAESCEERCYRKYGYTAAGHRCAAQCSVKR